MDPSGLHRRIVSVVGDTTFEAVAKTTRTSPATARRYLTGHAPSVDFLQSLCDHYRVNAHWLLTGHGPMYARDARAHALTHANPTELMGAIARALESMTERLDRLEAFVQTQEARLKAAAARTGRDAHHGQEHTRLKATARPARPRSGSVADALAQRPSPDADRAS